MPFEELETKANSPPQATMSYLLGTHKGKTPKANARPKLVICIPTTICGVSKSATFRLLVGTGVDAGKLLVRGDLKDPARAGKGISDGGVEPSQLKHYFRWHFGYVPKLGEDRFGPDKYAVRKVSDEEFEITVPKSWFEEAAGVVADDVDDVPMIPLKRRGA